MKVKKESEKAGLKLNIQKTKIIASGPITSWQIDGETMETVRDFIFLGFKITADGGTSHEIKRHLLLGKKSMVDLDSEGQGSLACYGPWDCEDKNEPLNNNEDPAPLPDCKLKCLCSAHRGKRD